MPASAPRSTRRGGGTISRLTSNASCGNRLRSTTADRGLASPSSMRRKEPSLTRTIAANDTMLGATRRTISSSGGRIPRSSTASPGSTSAASSVVERPDAHSVRQTPTPSMGGAVEAEHGDAAHALRTPGSSGHAKNRMCRTSFAGQLGEALGRRDVEDPNEVPQVLSNDDVQGYPERRLLAIGSDERRAVPLGENREREGDGQEGDCRNRSAGATCQPHRGQPRRERGALPLPPPAGQHREDWRNRDRRRDRTSPGRRRRSTADPSPRASRSSSATPPTRATPRHEQRRDRNEVDRSRAARPRAWAETP